MPFLVIAIYTNQTMPEVSNDHWKKIAMQKYLVDEIDLHTLKTILDTIEDDGNKGNVRSDPSYR